MRARTWSRFAEGRFASLVTFARIVTSTSVPDSNGTLATRTCPSSSTRQWFHACSSRMLLRECRLFLPETARQAMGIARRRPRGEVEILRVNRLGHGSHRDRVRCTISDRRYSMGQPAPVCQCGLRTRKHRRCSEDGQNLPSGRNIFFEKRYLQRVDLMSFPYGTGKKQKRFLDIAVKSGIIAIVLAIWRNHK